MTCIVLLTLNLNHNMIINYITLSTPHYISKNICYNDLINFIITIFQSTKGQNTLGSLHRSHQTLISNPSMFCNSAKSYKHKGQITQCVLAQKY